MAATSPIQNYSFDALDVDEIEHTEMMSDKRVKEDGTKRVAFTRDNKCVVCRTPYPAVRQSDIRAAFNAGVAELNSVADERMMAPKHSGLLKLSRDCSKGRLMRGDFLKVCAMLIAEHTSPMVSREAVLHLCC